MKTYLFFEDIETELANMAPPIVYKYRTWNSGLHKSLLINQEIWLSHPFDLNDPLDVRPEHEFDLSEVNDQRYFDKMLVSADELFSHLTPSERRQRAEEQWEYTKANPQHILDRHNEIQNDRERHNPYGVFSTSVNGLSNHLWREYSADGTGYALGFKTVELCREMKCGFGWVTYSDAPYKYSFLEERSAELLLYQKKDKWKDEEEFRFITATVDILRPRLFKFSIDVVAEVILGENISKENEVEIISQIKKIYGSELPIYKVHTDGNGSLSRKLLS